MNLRTAAQIMGREFLVLGSGSCLRVVLLEILKAKISWLKIDRSGIVEGPMPVVLKRSSRKIANCEWTRDPKPGLGKRCNPPCCEPFWGAIFRPMNTLLEIEATVDQLPTAERQELLAFSRHPSPSRVRRVAFPRDLRWRRLMHGSPMTGHRRFLAGA